MEVEAACVVLGNHDLPCGSSCSIDLVRSLDDEMGSCFRHHPCRLRGLIRDALGCLRCQEAQGGPKAAESLRVECLGCIKFITLAALFRGIQ